MLKGITHIALKEKGDTGATGAIYFPRGEWQAGETYTRTDKVIEYVIFDGYAYEVQKSSVTGGNNPLADTQSGGGNWKSMGKYDIIATQVLLANFAILAGAVFWNGRLMSQAGTDNSGNPSTAFKNYNEDANGNETGTFHPNILIDFLNGYLKGLKGKIAGWILKSNKLMSQTGTIAGSSSTDYTNANFVPAVFLDGLTGDISLAGGKILLKPDGSGQLASGSVSWNAAGNVTMNNVTTNSGTFNGIINANGGIRVGVRHITGSATLDAADSLVIIQGSATNSFTVYLPVSPPKGQMITFNNILNSQLNITISIPTDATGFIVQGFDTSKTIQLANGRAKQLIYSSSYARWYVVGQY
jgi:hypothetical protein